MAIIKNTKIEGEVLNGVAPTYSLSDKRCTYFRINYLPEDDVREAVKDILEDVNKSTLFFSGMEPVIFRKVILRILNHRFGERLCK